MRVEIKGGEKVSGPQGILGSSRVEIKGAERVSKWSARDFVALAMLGFSVAVVVVTCFMLYSH